MNNAGGVVTLVLIYLLVFGGLGIGALVSYILRPRVRDGFRPAEKQAEPDRWPVN